MRRTLDVFLLVMPAAVLFAGVILLFGGDTPGKAATTIYGSVIFNSCPSPTELVKTSAALTGATQVIAGVAAKQTYLCDISLTAPNNAVNFLEGTGANCATGTQMLGQTAGAHTTAAAGYVFNNATAPGVGLVKPGLFMVSATAGDSVCVIAASATQVTFTLWWAQQ